MHPSKASDLKSHIGYKLRKVSNAVSHSFAHKLSDSGVTVAEWVILREMYTCNGVTSPSVVAETTGLTRGAVSKLIERLIKKKLVLRSEASEDRRYQDIKLTTSSTQLVPKLAKLADQNDEFFFSNLTKAERKNLIEILDKLTIQHKLQKSPIE